MTIPFAARVSTHLRLFQSRWQILFLRLAGVRIASGCFVGPGCDLMPGNETARRGSIDIGSGSELASNVVLYPYNGTIHLGQNIHLGPGTVLYGHGGIIIGDDCVIAMHCRILSSEHTIPPKNRHIRWEADILKPTRLGKDVWLGAGVTVLGGVTIGEGCVVGAGAVVASDLPPYAIAYGVPAQVKGWRKDAADEVK